MIEKSIAGILSETDRSGKKPQTRKRNVRVAKALNLNGKRVLDLGCGTGLYSFYLAENADQVVGVDHNLKRIETANRRCASLGFKNVEFLGIDLREDGALDDLGHFDAVFAWGLLHRFPDPFNFFAKVSFITDVLSLEFEGLDVSPDLDFNFSQHSDNLNKSLDPTNIRKPNLDEVANNMNQDIAFWHHSPRLVKTLGQRFGFQFSEVLGVGDELRDPKTPKATIKKLGSLFEKTLNIKLPTGRIHMLLWKREKPHLSGLKDINVRPADWDHRGW